MKIDDLVQMAFDCAKSIVETSSQEAMPIFLIHTPDGNITPVMVMWNSREEKLAAYKLIRKHLDD